jgi:hypothetical protein
MSNNNSNSKKTICCIYGIIVLLFLGAHTIASGQTKSDNSGEIVKRLVHPPEPTGRFVARSRIDRKAMADRKAEEAYEKRNAEITPWAEDGMPQNPGNAALLYYQAFLLRPDLPKEVIRIYPGAEPNRQIRTYLGRCLPVIEIVEIASRMPQCIWGVWPERQLSEVALRRAIGPLQNILLVDARTLAADGHYRVALERCLTVRRIARHLSEDPELYTYSKGSDSLALIMVQHVLGVMPPDADILTWFRGQLGVVQGAPPSFAKELQARIKIELKHIRTYPARLASLRSLLVEGAKDEQAKENARNLTDEQILLRIREGLQCFLDSIFRILDSERTYEQKLAQMQRHISKLTEADDADPVTKDTLTMINIGGMINIVYPHHVWHQANINGVKAAVEVYLVVAKTGRLPESLPDYLPKDPSTGQDFVYEITDEGFALRCQDEKFLSRYSRRLEFKVKK